MLTPCPKCNNNTVFLNNVCEHCGCKVVKCIECGNIVEEESSTCNYCGFPIKETKKIQEKIIAEKETEELLELEQKAKKALSSINTIQVINIVVSVIICFAAIAFLVILLIKFGNLKNIYNTEHLEKYNTLKDQATLYSILFVVSMQIYRTLDFLDISHRTIKNLKTSNFNFDLCQNEIMKNSLCSPVLKEIYTVKEIDVLYTKKFSWDIVFYILFTTTANILICIGLLSNISNIYNVFYSSFNIYIIIGLVIKVIAYFARMILASKTIKKVEENNKYLGI